jgi:hypothetical protein
METYGGEAMLVTALALILFLVLGIFFLVTQESTLNAIRPQNRSMGPGQVWLQLIPFFNLVWQFIVVSRIAESISREMSESEIFSFEEPRHTVYEPGGEKPTYQIGIAYCVLYCIAVIPIPLLKGLASLACIVCWIVYWVKLAGYKKRIQEKNYGETPPVSP